MKKSSPKHGFFIHFFPLDVHNISLKMKIYLYMARCLCKKTIHMAICLCNKSIHMVRYLCNIAIHMWDAYAIFLYGGTSINVPVCRICTYIDIS